MNLITQAGHAIIRYILLCLFTVTIMSCHSPEIERLPENCALTTTEQSQSPRPGIYKESLPNCDKTDASLTPIVDRTMCQIDYYIWDYTTDSQTNKIWFYVLTGLGILVATAVSVMIALDLNKSAKQWIKLIMVALPIVGIAFTTAISQFHIREIWGLRANGIADLETQRANLLVHPCDATVLHTAMTQLAKIKSNQNLLGGAFSSGTSVPPENQPKPDEHK